MRNPVPAAAEGLPPTIADPLGETIAAYYAGLDDFEANAPGDNKGADAYAAVSYEPPMERLIGWSDPAATRQSAIAALRLVVSSLAVGDDCVAKPMAAAALSFFEEDDRATPATTVDIATLRDIVSEVRASSAPTVEDQLADLFDKFNTAVRAIDPSIAGGWVGYDANKFKLPTFIVFERPGAQFTGWRS